MTSILQQESGHKADGHRSTLNFMAGFNNLQDSRRPVSWQRPGVSVIAFI
jgi:hypothetical protein